MRIGIDVGGSHVGLGVVNENGKIFYKKEKDYQFHEKDMSNIVVNTIIELLKELIEENQINIKDVETIGIAIPGTVSDGIIIKAENLGIRNLEIAKILKNEFEVPIFLQNDAKCAAIAEKKFGSLNKYDDAMFLIVGTGIGGAVFLNGELLKPKRYSGFELGHIVIGTNGEKCGCGRIGCFETYGSIKRLKKKIQEEFKLPDTDGIKIKQFIIQNQDNEKLKDMIDKYLDDLATGITNLINIFEPEAVSLGGSFAYYEDILLNRLERRIIEKGELFNREREIPKFIVAELKNDAGIIGAAMQF